MAKQSVPFSNVQSVSDTDLSNQLQSYFGCMRKNISSFYDETMAFAANLANMPACRKVMAKYGTPSCGDSWVPCYQFYIKCKYYALYPMPQANPANCTKIKALINAINTEIDNVKRNSLPGGSLTNITGPANMAPLNDLLSEAQGLYASLDCDNTIVQQQQLDQIATVQQVAQQAASTTAGSAQTKTNNIMTYLLIGVGLLLLVGGAMIIFHKKKS